MGKSMTRRDEILTIMAEECAEVIQEIMKVKRFGDQEHDGQTAMQRLEKELGDLYCMIDLLWQDDYISWTKLDEYSNAKSDKLKKWSNLYES